jgi:hypothetical protein
VKRTLDITIELRCPVCHEPLPERGNRRVRIPWLAGKPRLVHPACAPQAEAQASLAEPDGRLLGARPTTRRNR